MMNTESINEPSIAILVPTYSRVNTLKKTLQSVIAQKVRPKTLRVYVSDNSSEDSTKEFLQELSQKHDFIQPYFQKENIGGNANILFLLQKSTEDYVFLLCDDDLLDPDFFAEMYPILTENPSVDVIYCSLQFIDKDDQFISNLQINAQPGLSSGPDCCLNQLRSHHMVMGTMYRRQKMIDAGGWDEKAGSHLDCTAFCRTSIRSRQTYFHPKNLVRFRLWPNTWSQQVSSEIDTMARWYRYKLDRLQEDCLKFAPHLRPEFEKTYQIHAFSVLHDLEIRFAHDKINARQLRQSLKALLEVFPEAASTLTAAKLNLSTWIGLGWLRLTRKILRKPNPYKSELSQFWDF